MLISDIDLGHFSTENSYVRPYLRRLIRFDDPVQVVAPPTSCYVFPILRVALLGLFCVCFFLSALGLLSLFLRYLDFSMLLF
jgi:hypothetical protein